MENQQTASTRFAPSEPDVWYECTGAAQKLRVHFTPKLIGDLQPQAVAALRETGREIGGILLGTVEPQADGEALRVERAVVIPCAHRQGPAYVLAAEECVALETAARAQHAGNRRVIGYFRSQTRPDLQLYDEDVELLETCFVEAVRLVLLLKPLESGLCTAGLFFRHENGLRPDFCDLEVPFFDPNAGGVALTPPAPRPRAPRPASPPAPALPTPAAPPRRRRHMSTAALLTVVAVLSFLFAVFWTPYVLQRWRSSTTTAAPSAPKQRLDLQVSDQAERLTVTWNREAPILRTARRGVLEIQDGPQRKELALDTGELTAGSLVYLPATGDILFRLEVSIDDTHTVAESVRFISGRTGTDASGSILLSQTAHPVASPARPSGPGLNRSPVPAPRRWEAPNTPVPAKTRTDMPTPPRLSGTGSSAPAPAMATQSPAPPPVNRVTPAPRTPPPAATAPRVASYEPPKVLRQVPVSVPPNVRTMLSGNASIEVRVSIDAHGKVTKAEIASGSGAVAHLLGVTALDAARRYQFAPAQLDGKPIRSEMLITFRFAR